MIRTAAIAAALLTLVSPAHARDARLATRLYNSDEVVRIDGRAGVQATITFAEDEHIENVAVGDSTSWQITPNKRANLLFVKPLAARKPFLGKPQQFHRDIEQRLVADRRLEPKPIGWAKRQNGPGGYGQGSI